MKASDGGQRRRVARAAGFTLLEVMGAVALLGLSVAVLAQSGIQGMRMEGDAVRRARASLWADQLLGEIEARSLRGEPLPPGEEQPTDAADELAASVSLRPFDPAAFGLSGWPAPRGNAPGAAAIDSRTPSAFPLPAGASAPLLTAEVRVSWVEGDAEQEVTRTSVVLDRAALAQIVSALVPPAGGSPGEASQAPEDGATGAFSGGRSDTGSGASPGDGTAVRRGLPATGGGQP